MHALAGPPRMHALAGHAGVRTLVGDNRMQALAGDTGMCRLHARVNSARCTRMERFHSGMDSAGFARMHSTADRNRMRHARVQGLLTMHRHVMAQFGVVAVAPQSASFRMEALEMGAIAVRRIVPMVPVVVVAPAEHAAEHQEHGYAVDHGFRFAADVGDAIDALVAGHIGAARFDGLCRCRRHHDIGGRASASSRDGYSTRPTAARGRRLAHRRQPAPRR